MAGIRAFEDLFSDAGYVSLKNHLYNYRIRKRAVRRTLGKDREETVLEVGSGISPMTDSREFTSVVYSDVSLSSLRILKTTGRGGTYVAADGMRLPFRRGCFGVVVCSEVLEHVEDDAQALREMARVLRPGGALIITFPHRKFYFAGDDRFVHHYRRYETAEMEELMHQAGLVPVLTRKVLGPLEKLTMIGAVAAFAIFGKVMLSRTNGFGEKARSRIPTFLFIVANRLYEIPAWLDGRISPKCVSSVLLMKAVKAH